MARAQWHGGLQYKGLQRHPAAAAIAVTALATMPVRDGLGWGDTAAVGRVKGGSAGCCTACAQKTLWLAHRRHCLAGARSDGGGLGE